MAKGIPVVLSGDHDKPIGKAVLDSDGDLVMLVSGDLLIRHIKNLVDIGQIKCLTLGVEYITPVMKD